MTDMFIPKKEKIIIITEAIIYVLLLILASYFTICGNIFIRMVPMIYILGIFGVMLFNKPITTIILSSISSIVFGTLVEGEINSSVLLFSLYSGLMVFLGEVTGHILNLLYENFKLRKFIKYYHKIIYIIVLIACVLIPLLLNNVVNSNMLRYIISKNNVEMYVSEHYAYTEFYIQDVKYIPSYKEGMYEFDTIIDGINVVLNYTLDGKIADVNTNNRKDALNKIANAEINIMLKENDLSHLDVRCNYDYSRIATNPDVIKININDVKTSNINDVVTFIECIKDWDKYELVSRIDVDIDGKNVTITKESLNEKDITSEYILNGMNYEVLSSKEDN